MSKKIIIFTTLAFGVLFIYLTQPFAVIFATIFCEGGLECLDLLLPGIIISSLIGFVLLIISAVLYLKQPKEQTAPWKKKTFILFVVIFCTWVVFTQWVFPVLDPLHQFLINSIL
jgi:type III secretory pathway component EscS